MKLLDPSPTNCDVRDLQDGRAVDQVLLVREREIRRTRSGADYLRLALADRTGVVSAIAWDDVDGSAATAAAGEPVRVIGSFSEHARYGPQITVHSLLAPLEIDWERLLDAPAIPVVELERKLDEHIAGLRDPHLAVLMRRLLGTGSISGHAFRHAFAAQYNHHAYRCGLLEHSLQVADATADATRTFAGIDRELALCGALLHDIGKLDAYSGNACGVRLNDAGRLIGEIPSGYYTVRREIERSPTSRRIAHRRCFTSSSRTTVALSTAAQCSRQPVRRSWCTRWTSSAATSEALTDLNARLLRMRPGPASTARLAEPCCSPTARQPCKPMESSRRTRWHIVGR